MKALLFVLPLLLTACSPREQIVYRSAPAEQRRFELVTGPKTFLLDNRSGRVWLLDRGEDFMEITPPFVSRPQGPHWHFRVEPDPEPTNAFTDLIP